jgi:guanylate kinase
MYDYVVVNEDLDKAVKDVASIVDAESLRRVRSSGLLERLNELSSELRQQIEAHS